jgi:hypothetical protein
LEDLAAFIFRAQEVQEEELNKKYRYDNLGKSEAVRE